MIYQLSTDKNEINSLNVNEWLTDFKNYIQPNRVVLGAYYDGENEVKKQNVAKNRPNHKISVNLAKYITDVATSYFVGKDVTYAADDDKLAQIGAVIEKINDINKNCDAAEIDFNVAGDMSVYGIGYQLVYAKNTAAAIEERISFKRLDPLTTFYVVDNTIENNPVCAVYYYNYYVNRQQRTKAYVYTDEALFVFDGFGSNLSLVPEESGAHLMGQIPILQSLNNDDAFGDYKSVKDLIDAVNLLVSSSTDDLQSVANAILAFYGGTANKENIDLINTERVANLPPGAKAEWLIKQINPEASQTQLDNLLKFIFMISQVPDLSDEAFAGNLSGVALQFKLWGLDQLWSTKQKKYTKTLYQRIKIILHLLQYRVKNNIELLNDITINFSKNLPQNMAQDYEMAKSLAGVVSMKTLFKNLAIVNDPDREIEQIRIEKIGERLVQPAEQPVEVREREREREREQE